MITTLRDASRLMVQRVDAIDAAAYSEPSLLPGWSRGHVLAHLALNAEGLTDAVRGVVAGDRVPMYSSPGARDSDIEELAGAAPDELRRRLFGGVTELNAALGALGPEHADASIERTPGSERTFTAADVPVMRLREVEIHQVDLGLDYHARDWPRAFAELLVGQLAGRAAVTLVATDLGRSWQGGPDAPTVSGTAADLGWWLSGRGDGHELTSEHGELPRIEAW